MDALRTYVRRASAPLLRIEAADELARAVADRGALPVDEAAAALLALRSGPQEVARSILDDVVAQDARLVRRGLEIAIAAPAGTEEPLETARFCVVDLETTGFSASSSRVCEAAAVLLEGGEVVGELELRDGGGRLDAPGHRLLAFAGSAVLAGHNLRFDLAFIDHETSSSAGTRLASPTVDTLVLARRLLRGRVERFTLAALADFVGTAAEPCHRALADARATAEILLYLIAAARERGARVVSDLCALARPGHPEMGSGGGGGPRSLTT